VILPHPPQIGLFHEIRTRAMQLFRQRSQPAAAVEFDYRGHDGIAFGFRAGVLDGFRQ